MLNNSRVIDCPGPGCFNSLTDTVKRHIGRNSSNCQNISS